MSKARDSYRSGNELDHQEDDTNPSERFSSATEERPYQRIFHACIHPFLSGFFGSVASLIGKHTFSGDFGGWGPKIQLMTHGNAYIEFAIRVVLFVLTLYMNSFMLKFFINSLKRNGATVAKVLSLSVSFFMNGVISFFYFDEPMQLEWCVGLFLIMVGIYFLVKDKDNQEKENAKPSLDQVELVRAASVN